MKRLVTLLLGLACLAFGDGGTMLFHMPAGTFDVTVFSKADAVRVGTNDLSVMVQKHESQTTIMDAKVLLHLTRSVNGDITRVTALATHQKADNKTLYAAQMKVPSAGAWKLGVDLTVGNESAFAAANINVQPPLPPIATYWPYVAMVPFLGAAFLINRWLKRKMGVGRRAR